MFPTKGATVKLSEFIGANHKGIVAEWETFAGTMLPAAGGMSATALRDHAEEILAAIVEDLESPQAGGEQSRKSKGQGEEHRMEAVGKTHAAIRIQDGFRLSQLVAEYRALRASVLRLFERAGGTDMRQVTRFNESIDEALVEATNRYMLVMDRTRDQFLAILGHDLRNPLGAILMSTGLLTSARGAEDRTVKIAARILSSAGRMQRMVNDLLDLTRTRLGSGIPIAPRPMDLEELSREVLAELEAFHPDCRFDFHSEGDLRGVWDSDRLAQVLSNLVGNALQHGERNRPIRVVAREDAEKVVIEVHNEGHAIPRAMLANIFEPMVRDAGRAEEQASRSLGLGLHITREIVMAHGGTVMVTSTDSAGTTFSVRLPRRSAAASPSAPSDEHPDRHDATGGIVAQ
jgi:signal transduction histidine kinase